MCTTKRKCEVKKIIDWKRPEMLNEFPCSACGSAYCSAYDLFLHS